MKHSNTSLIISVTISLFNNAKYTSIIDITLLERSFHYPQIDFIHFITYIVVYVLCSLHAELSITNIPYNYTMSNFFEMSHRFHSLKILFANVFHEACNTYKND